MMHEWLLRGADPALLLCLLHSCFPKRQMCPNHDSVRPFSPPFKSIISNPSAKRSLKRSLSSPRTTSSQRAGCLLPSVVFLSSIFWHRSLRHSRVRSHHPRALLTRVKNLCLDNEFAESKEDRLNRRGGLARAYSPREETPSLRQGRSRARLFGTRREVESSAVIRCCAPLRSNATLAALRIARPFF